MTKESTIDLLTYADISVMTGVPVGTLKVWLTRGKLPPPDVKPNKRTALWQRSTIEDWMESTK